MPFDSPTEIKVSPWEQFHRLVRWTRTALCVFSALFVVLLVGQIVHIYELASRVHPLLGAIVALLLLAGAGWLVGVPIYRFLRLPRVVEPPAIPPPDSLKREHLRSELRFIDRYLANCARNPAAGEARSLIPNARHELGSHWQRSQNATDADVAALSLALTEWSGRTMPTVLKEVDQKAERLIYQEALAVGLATAVSPNGTLDAFVMLWRSVRLVSGVAVLYYGRPGVWGTLAVCRDVAIATALAGNVQSVADSLGGLVTKSVGGAAGFLAGPAIEGLTNSLVLVRIGYLAQQRCRSYRQWDAFERRSALREALVATQRVSMGLTAEFLRQVGTGVGAIAGAAATGVGQAATAAASGVSNIASATVTGVSQAANVVANAAESAIATAHDWGQAIANVVRHKKEDFSKRK